MDNIDQLAEAIKKIIELKGMNAFENSIVFCVMIDDLAPKLTKERKIFRRILDDKILSEIKSLYTNKSKQQNNSWMRLEQELLDDYGLTDEWCSILLLSFCQAFGQEDYKVHKKYVDGDKKLVGRYQKSVEREETDIKAKKEYELTNKYFSENNYREAAEWCRKAAEHGYVEAQFGLGFMYEQGYGVKQNYQVAAEWYRKAADQGHVDAQYSLFGMYYKGYGVEQDYKAAVEWCQKSAEQGNARAQAELGIMYTRGDGVEKNYKMAVEWHRKAAEQGNAWGQDSLGFMYEQGYGVEQNYQKAVEWYRKAADQGYENAQSRLGYMYENGYGVEQNFEIAMKWYQKAVENGNKEAQNSLRLLKEKNKKKRNSFGEKIKDWLR